MASTKCRSGVLIVPILLWMTRTIISTTMPTTDFNKISTFPESLPRRHRRNSTEWEIEPPVLVVEAQDDQSNITTGNLTIPICPDEHVCPERSCTVPQITNQACSCDEMCTFFGDCCPRTLSKEHPRNCHLNGGKNFSSIYDRSQFSCVKVESSHSSAYFYLISKCSGPVGNDLIREKCESASLPAGAFSLESVPLSLGNIVSYRNVYCAICNEQDPLQLKPWLVTMQCSKYVTEELKNNTRTLEEVVRDQLCPFSVDPSSDGTSARECIRMGGASNYVDTCPLSSDMGLQLACASFSAHIKFFLETKGCVAYKNPACYACSVGHLPYHERICTDGCLKIKVVGGILPLSVLFDFSSQSGVRILQNNTLVSETTVVCQSGEVFDPYVASCIRLSCPEGYEMIGNECAKEISSEHDLACSFLTLDSSQVVTVTVITNDQGLCASQQSRDQNFNLDRLILATKNHSLLECEENELDDQYETVFIWQFEEDSQLTDYESSIISDLSKNNTNNAVCNISSFSMYSRCKPNDIGKGSICTKAFNKTFTEPTDTTTHEGDLNPFTNAPGTSSSNEFKVLKTIYNLIHERNDIMKNMSTFTCNLTATDLLCSSSVFNISLFVRLGDDGMLQYVPSGDVINPAEYVSLGDGTIRACQFLSQNGTFNETTIYSFFRYSPTQTTLSLAGTTLSLVSIFITLVCYITFPTLRRLVSNQLIMAFCGTLFVAQCLFLFGGMASSVSQNLCRTLAAFSHFFWLSVFTLSSSIAFDLRRTFGSNKTIRVSTASRKVLSLYIAVATGIPLLIVVISLILSAFKGDDIDLHYGNELACWVGGGKAILVVFGVPVAVLLAFNFSCFMDTVRGISHSKRDSMNLHEGTDNRSSHLELLKIAIKISSLMGFTWLFGFVAAFSKHQAVWYIFIILNSLQGVYIFLAFAATRRVFDLWRGLVLEKASDTSMRDSSLQLRDKSTSSSVLKTSI